jgi:VanZ family protein
MKKILFKIAMLTIFGLSLNAQTIQYYQTGEEFSGKLSSWKNVKTDFGAVGNGVTNDAPAINAALLAMKVSAADSFSVLYFPAGTYLINDSIYNPGNGYDGMAIVGEDPANTIIKWNGAPNGTMLYLTGWYLRVSRLTFEGNNIAHRGIFKSGGFSTHNEFSDIVFKNFNTGIGLDLSGTTQGQAENAILRCTFSNCSSGIASCNWNSLDQWVWFCLFEDCNFAINQCIGYFQIYNNVFLRSKTYDIGSSPYKNAIVNNTSINSKCFYAGTSAYIRGNKIYSNVDSFYTNAGSNTVMLDNLIRTTKDSMATSRVGTANMFIGNTFSTLTSKWKKWPFQPPFNTRTHGIGSGFVINKQIEKGIDGNPATSFAVDAAPFGIKWNCPMGTKKTVVKYTLSAPLSSGGKSPKDFQLLGSNDWGYTWDILDFKSNQSFTGGANPVTYTIPNTTAYAMYELLSLNPWQNSTSGGRSIINTTSQAGTYCEQMNLSAFPRNVYQNIAVKGDTSYLASGWMKSNAVTTNGNILVYWYNTTYAPTFTGGYPSAFIKVDTIGIITGTNGWINYSKTIIAPSNALSASFYLGSLSNGTSSGTVWFDSFSFSNATNISNNLLLDPDFESGQNQTGLEINEFTLLDASGIDITKDADGFVSGANEPWGNFYAFDNAVVDTSAIPFPTTVQLPGTPQNPNRMVFDVVKGTGNDANAIQTQINLAALQPLGTKPIVHIPIGQFSINTTIVVPAGSDMQILGDGLGTGVTTRLNWSGNQIGPLLLCQGPSRVTIKDLLLNVPYGTFTGPEALVIENSDQVGGRIFGNQFCAGGPQWTQPCDIGMYADQIENSDITMTCFYPGYGTNGMVKANGGPILSAGGNTNGQISLLGGATGDCQNLFNVSNGGRIDAEGMWNEGDWARTSGLLNLSSCTGKVSVACMSWILLTQTAYPMVNATNFNGSLTLLLNHFDQAPQTYVPITGSGANLNIFSGYNDFGANNTIGATADSTWQDMTSPNANSDFISNTSVGGRVLEDVISKTHNVRADSTSIINSLAQLRAVRTDPPNDRVAGVTDVKLFRVAAWGTQGHIAAHFNGASSSSAIELVVSQKANAISLYPTVVNHNYTVSYTLPENGTTYITVFDVYGRQVSIQKIEDAVGNHKLNCLADELTAGTYFLRLQSGAIMETKKFIVIR